MTFNKGTYKVEGDKLTIDKAELEAWRDHYWNIAYELANDEFWRLMLYTGKHDVFVDLLKLFDEAEL